MNLDVTQEQLVELAQGLLDGIPFTEREWTGRGRPFSSGQGGSFRKLRSDWLKQGLLDVVSDKDNRQGFDLTESGWAFCVKTAGITPLSPSTETSPQMRASTEFGGREAELTDEQLDAIEQENAAYAEKFGS